MKEPENLSLPAAQSPQDSLAAQNQSSPASTQNPPATQVPADLQTSLPSQATSSPSTSRKTAILPFIAAAAFTAIVTALVSSYCHDAMLAQTPDRYTANVSGGHRRSLPARIFHRFLFGRSDQAVLDKRKKSSSPISDAERAEYHSRALAAGRKLAARDKKLSNAISDYRSAFARKNRTSLPTQPSFYVEIILARFKSYTDPDVEYLRVLTGDSIGPIAPPSSPNDPYNRYYVVEYRQKSNRYNVVVDYATPSDLDSPHNRAQLLKSRIPSEFAAGTIEDTINAYAEDYCSKSAASQRQAVLPWFFGVYNGCIDYRGHNVIGINYEIGAARTGCTGPAFYRCPSELHTCKFITGGNGGAMDKAGMRRAGMPKEWYQDWPDEWEHAF